MLSHVKCARGAVRQGHKAALARKLAERQADVRAKQEQLPATEQACNHPDTSGSLHHTTACLDRATKRGQSSALLQWMLKGPGCEVLAGAHPRAGAQLSTCSWFRHCHQSTPATGACRSSDTSAPHRTGLRHLDRFLGPLGTWRQAAPQMRWC